MMSVKELQDYLNLSERTVYSMIKNKDIPRIKIGGVWRFEKARIDAWITNRHEKEELLVNEKINVLVVDDSPEILEILRDGISDLLENSNVQTAANGVQALIAVGKSKPDFMILDIEMPEMNGIDVCRKLKENPVTNDIVIIAISGFAEKGYKEKLLAAGVDNFLEKPLRAEDIVEIIKQTALPK